MSDELDASDIPSPTITSAALLAAEIFEAIEGIIARIGRLESAHPMTAPFVRGGRTVSDDAIISMIAAVQQEPVLAQLGTFDVDDARAMMQFNESFRHVLDRINALASSVSFTMEAWKARIVFDLFRTYDIMKGLARHPDHADLGAHVEILRREIGRKGPPRNREKKD